MKSKLLYRPPVTECVPVETEDLLAQSPGYNPDNNTEYFDEEYGGVI